jgi:hypothetical protein
MKVDDFIFIWFRISHRFSKQTNSFESYRFFHANHALYRVSFIIVSLILKNEFDITENVIIFELYDWWWKMRINTSYLETIMIEITTLKFDMYRHHLRVINEKKNYEWQRNMIHFIVQQIMRQNSLYYRQYCDLRFDEHWQLISYFYYIKYAKSRDRTAFRHINQNISFLLIIEREANMIQNSLSLNDENVNNCIIILSEMHKHLTSWWERVTIKKLTRNEWVHKVIDFMFTKQNAEDFDTSWTDVLERREDIRVTLSTLSYETNESIISIRRTMLSWYVDILNNYESIENMKIETWIELIATHRDLIVVRTFSFDFLNKYDAISYKFSTAMKVIDLESLSNALVERRRWDTSAILVERDLWLREDLNNP